MTNTEAIAAHRALAKFHADRARETPLNRNHALLSELLIAEIVLLEECQRGYGLLFQGS